MGKIFLLLKKMCVHMVYSALSTYSAKDVTEVESKQQKLARLKRQLIETKEQMNAVSADMDAERKRVRFGKLLHVGLIAEEAGILDSYNANDLYLLLVMNRTYLCQHGEMGTSGTFTAMHNLGELKEERN